MMGREDGYYASSNQAPSSPLLVLVLAVCLCGCDGLYSYDFDGTLLRPDRHTPVINSAVRVTDFDPARSDSPITFDAKTDTTGHFSGTLNARTAWVFVIRPRLQNSTIFF